MSDSSQQDDSSNNEFNLKESFKNKRGGMPRHAEDIEYVALTLKEQKIILKKSQVDVEEDLGDGSTPKLLIPKIRLLGETSNIFCSLDLNDLHVYVFSPWMLEALRVRSSVVNLQNEFLPLMISRQFRSFPDTNNVKHVFGLRHWEKQPNTLIEKYENLNYSVCAHVIPPGPRLALRCCNFSSYLYANREYLLHLLHPPNQYILKPTRTNPTHSYIPYNYFTSYPDTTVPLSAKYQSLLFSDLPSEKITLKLCVLGKCENWQTVQIQ